jgi:hypothetical protein
MGLRTIGSARRLGLTAFILAALAARSTRRRGDRDSAI